ncbi:TIGR03619 family F420-dependent LLM class oxidoreductase [Actinomadura sp. HBU206391]|uniref:TIGR03619 family F420-dependent LLM class oxidoreductase n=1 Tax=Actinomadura sp. HBU206391 TaxID=2731692 RepID=UPI0016505BDD|nr:TIGR03619 family F420-dependent LLM class oxidoreductase [Actinomadura sp. HBU206391]MBC6463302.1 TIGR03619 family F420-dependent LLM class oxidoreductase [Actinomadura sp. HBU206391]
MRIGLAVPQYGAFTTNPDDIVEVSRGAEAMGFDSLWAGDRILAPLEPRDRYPGRDGVLPPEYAAFLDPLGVLTLSAAVTERVRLGTSTLNALWYAPVILARALTTLDVISRGRLDVGFGLGWSRDEYGAVNVPWEGRGGRLDETLDVLEKIWSDEVVEHDGARFSIPPTTIRPKPVQRPRPPILLAGFTPAALDRVGRRADGWLGVGMPLTYLTVLWESILKAADAGGRDRSELRLVQRLNPLLAEEKAEPDRLPTTGTLGQFIDYARSAAGAGVDELFIDLQQTTTTTGELLDIAGAFIEGVRAG